MVEGSLDTTNLLLGILAAVSVLEAVLLVGIGVMHGVRAACDSFFERKHNNDRA